MTAIFWTSLLVVLYCYAGYPALMAILAKIIARPVRKGDYEPTITMILSVYNEADVIERKIANLLSLDYPSEKLSILIGSDASDDGTDELILRHKNHQVTLVRSDVRRGKAATLNELAGKAKGELIVFTDARQEFQKDALKELARNFADPDVGSASGELIFTEDGGAGGTAKGVGLYWTYEKAIRNWESAIHSMLGATGAIYAIRKELYTPLPEQVVLDDMFIPLEIIQKGYRAVMDPAARAFDRVADHPREEYRRKVRTLYGNYQIFALMPGIFNPLTSPIALQVFSHKFLRVVAPFFLIAIFLSNWTLIGDPIYDFIFRLQLLFYGAALLGGLARYENYGILGFISKACYAPYVFCLLNVSALMGFIRFMRQSQAVTWEKARRAKL